MSSPAPSPVSSRLEREAIALLDALPDRSGWSDEATLTVQTIGDQLAADEGDEMIQAMRLLLIEPMVVADERWPRRIHALQCIQSAFDEAKVRRRKLLAMPCGRTIH